MRPRTPLLALLVSALALLAAPLPVSAAAAAPDGTYIVQLNPAMRAPRGAAQDQVAGLGGQLVGVYEHAFKGYTARLSATAAEQLKRNPNVISVEPDAEVHAFVQTVPTGVRRIFGPDNPNLDIDGTDDVRIDVDVAVVDSGVDNTHPDLNVVARANCLTGLCVNNSGTDDNGHGSHVAGTVGALDNTIGPVGVAPGARIHGVKVLNAAGSGTLSGIAAGINWVVARASTIEVINLSLGCNGCSSSAISTAITNAVNAGIVVVVAAGNSHTNTSSFFPANHPDVVTVSALTDNDGLAGGAGAARSRAAARPIRTTPRRSTPTTAPRWRSRRRARASTRPTAQAATPRSAAPRWPARTWRARPPCSRRAPTSRRTGRARCPSVAR